MELGLDAVHDDQERASTPDVSGGSEFHGVLLGKMSCLEHKDGRMPLC
jgi:hypothetical protein